MLGDPVKAKVYATNVKGTSDASAVGGSATIIQIPDAPLTLTEDTSYLSPNILGLQWKAGFDGGSAIIDFKIEYRAQGASTFTEASGISNMTCWLTGLTLGTTYEIRVSARNIVGYSEPSALFTILYALKPPDQPSAPATFNSATDIVVTWSAPAANGSPITSYQIEFFYAGYYFAE